MEVFAAKGCFFNIKPLEVVFLMMTCKDLSQSFKKKLKKIQNIKLLQSQFSDKCILSNPDFLENFQKSLKYPITDLSAIFSSRTLLSRSSADVQYLAQYLVDFLPMKNTKLVAMLESDTLFLSFIPHQTETILWVASKKKKSIVHFLIKRYKFSAAEEILSAKFCAERFLMIQTRENITNPDDMQNFYKYEIYLVDINSVIQSVFDDHRKEILAHNISVDFYLSKENPVQTINVGNIKEQNLEIQGNSLFSHFCFQKQANRIILYTQNQGGMALIYNLQKKQIEAAYAYEPDLDILSLVVSKKNTSTDCLNMLLIDRGLKLFLLTFRFADQQFSTIEIKYSDKIINKRDTNLLKKQRKYQYGAIYQKTFISDYIIVNHNNEFWYFNLDSLTPKRVAQTQTLKNCAINSWCAFEDLLAVIYDQKYIAIFKFTPEGDFKELTRVQQPILYKSIWVTKENPIEAPLAYSRDFEVTELPPYLLMNHSYLIVIEFPPGTRGFNIYSTSLPEILMDKKVSTESYLYLNANRAACEVRSKNIFNGDPDIFFKRYGGVVDCEDMAKFVDNRILIRFESLNIFFNFESGIINLNKYRNDYSGSRGIDEIIPLNIKVPQILMSNLQGDKSKLLKKKIKHKLIPINDNHSKPVDVCIGQKLSIQKRIENHQKQIEAIRNKDKEINSLENGIHEQGAWKNSKQERKARIKDTLFNASSKYLQPLELIKQQFDLHSLPSYAQKEWYLRRIKKTKTRKERTYGRDLRTTKD